MIHGHGNDPMMHIEVSEMSKRFGGLQALDSVSLHVSSGEVTAIIGPNGAGKSTLVNCLTGTIPIDQGRISINQVAHATVRADALVELGISRTFQTPRMFSSLTVREHIELARKGFLRSRRARGARRYADKPAQVVEQLMVSVGLQAKSSSRPSELAYGEKRRLEVARALATEPHLLLLDEPAAGFTLSEQAAIARNIKEIAAAGVAVLLIEHHMDLIAEVSNRVVVLNFGKVLFTGAMSQARQDAQVIAAYLGTSAQ